MKSLDIQLQRAKTAERNYEWLKAAEIYEKTLKQASREGDQLGHLNERLGLCYLGHALQADKQDGFNEYIRKSIEAYETASNALASLVGPADQASGIRCKALALYCAQYLLKEHDEIRKGLYATLKLQKKALGVYKNCGDPAGKIAHGRDILQTINDLLEYEQTKEKRIELVDLGLGYSEEAIQACLDLKNERVLADIYLKASELCGTGSGILTEENQRVTCEKNQEEYLTNALELSEKAEDWITRAKAVSSHVHWQLLKSSGEAAPVYLRNMRDLLEDCRKGRIREVTTSIINSILYGLLHQLLSATDRDEADEIFGAIKKYGDESTTLNNITGGILRAAASLGDTYWNLGISYRYYGLLFENDPEARVRLMDKGIEIARKIPSHTSPVGRMYFLSTYSYHLDHRASIKQNAADRKKLLLEALDISNQWVKSIENLFPYFYRLIADHLLVYSSIRAKLAQMEDLDTKIKMLQEAIEYSKKGIEYFATGVLDKSMRIKLADSLFELGRILFELYKATFNHDFLRESFSMLEKATRTYSAEGLYMRTAETFWSLAKIQDATEQFQEAAKSFGEAARHFQLTIEKDTQLAETVKENIVYTEAWREIELAKYYHQDERYSDAANRYYNSSKILSETQKWISLSKYFDACGLMEKGEALSMKGKWEESLGLFKKAAQSLQHVLDSWEKLLANALTPEMEELRDWLSAVRVKEKFSRGRLLLEEARIFVKNGQNVESARHYEKAAFIFEELVNDVTEEQTRNELRTILFLCKAWQKMRQGEIEISPARYSEAATLCVEARNSTKKQRLALLALGSAALCKALEYGTMYKFRGGNELYASTKQQLERAAAYYAEAGFKSRSDYVVATARFFDALAYGSKAESELDPTKRRDLYIFAEKHFRQAAKLFEDSGWRKKEEVLRHLERVRQGKKLLLTAGEMLSGSAVISSSADVSTPIMTGDQPMGVAESVSQLTEETTHMAKFTWDDVGGYQETKEILREAVEYAMLYPEKYKKFGVRPPKGVLFYGPPGCGKTFLVKVVASVCNAYLVSIHGPEILTAAVGEPEAKIRDIFRLARQKAPSIIFFDEIDALAPKRSLVPISDVTARVVTQLLTEIDRLEPYGRVVVIATTNRPEIIDEALMRPGRFDRHVYVPLPDKEARRRIFQIHLRDKPIASDVYLDELAEVSEGYSAADISAICNRAATHLLRKSLLAVKEEKWTITSEEVKSIISKAKRSVPPEMLEGYQRFMIT